MAFPDFHTHTHRHTSAITWIMCVMYVSITKKQGKRENAKNGENKLKLYNSN